MASWQVMVGASVGRTLPGGWEAWEGFGRLCRDLTDLLGEPVRESPDAWRWGDVEGNDLTLFLHDESGRFIFRIDVREDPRPFVEGMVRVLRALGLKIALPDGNLLEPDSDVLAKIAASNVDRANIEWGVRT